LAIRLSWLSISSGKNWVNCGKGNIYIPR
jgi:hypothetical protein